MPSKKYERFFKPVSRNGFSSSGTYRGQGRIGQTSLSRTGTSCCNGSKSDGSSSINTKGLILSRVVNPTSVFNNTCDSKCAKPLVKELNTASQSEKLKSNVSNNMANCFVPGKDIHAATSSSDYMKYRLSNKDCVQGKQYQNISSDGKPTTD